MAARGKKPAPDHPWRRPLRRGKRRPQDSLPAEAGGNATPDLVELVRRAERGLPTQ